jgi:hypothetical protein
MNTPVPDYRSRLPLKELLGQLGQPGSPAQRPVRSQPQTSVARGDSLALATPSRVPLGALLAALGQGATRPQPGPETQLLVSEKR